MRQGTKIGIGLTVVVIGAAVAYVRFGAPKAGLPQASETPSVQPDEPVLAGNEPAAQPAEPETPAAASEGAVASPPSIAVSDNVERSFRALPIEPLQEAVTTAPAERTGLAELSTPSVDAEVEPVAAAEPEPSPAAIAPVLPEPAPDEIVLKPVSAATTSPSKSEHVIQPGETYSSLALKYFGNAKYANLIARANPGKDPRRLYVGAKVKIPPAPAGVTSSRPAAVAVAPAGSKAVRAAPALVDDTPAPIPPDRAYKVKPGESWQDLASRFLGDRGRWVELYELNKERVPRNPERLPKGMTIELPKGVSISSRPS